MTRKDEVPDHPELLIVPPRMNLYMKRNSEINNLLKRFVADEDHSVFSVDESFIDITASLKYFNCDAAYRLVKLFNVSFITIWGYTSRLALEITHC